MPGYTFIAVPTDLATTVIDLVERLTAGSTKSPVPQDDLLGWTELLLRRAYDESQRPMGDLLEFLAAHPDQEVTADEIAIGIGAERGWNTVAGMLGAFSRRCTGRYGRPGFPWEQRWDENSKARLKMPRAIADIVTDAAA